MYARLWNRATNWSRSNQLSEHEIEDLLRGLTPQVLGAVVRRYGHFDLAEDALQEGLLSAAMQWPKAGVPDNPRAWLIMATSRRLTDLLRSEQARQRREERIAQWTLPDERVAPPADAPAESDDTLILLLMCCHPSLTPTSQIALTLRAVGGLNTAEVARAFLVPEETMTRRISRAKQSIKESGIPFRMPSASERAERLAAVLHTLYLIFNEGYATTSGPSLQRSDLATEAIRLARMVHRLLPEDPEVTGLLALMLLTDARTPARTGPAGELVTLAQQDRSLWNAGQIAEGSELVERAVAKGDIGPYQLQAMIAALHDHAESTDATDWPQIVELYEGLMRIADNPVVALNHAVAVAMARGPRAGLTLLDKLQADARIADDPRTLAVRAHLLERAGDREAARGSYEAAARRTHSLPRQRYLNEQAARLASDRQ
jgi:RNA polymerase sigma factor (sigma-70 family)